MKTNSSGTGDNKNQDHSHSKHMWIMAVCCGLPVAGFLAIGLLGLNMPSLITFLLLICLTGMAGMMFMMHRDGKGSVKGRSCCQPGKTEDESADGMTYDDDNTRFAPAQPRQSDSLEA